MTILPRHQMQSADTPRQPFPCFRERLGPVPRCRSTPHALRWCAHLPCRGSCIGQGGWGRTSDLRFPKPARFLYATPCYIRRLLIRRIAHSGYSLLPRGIASGGERPVPTSRQCRSGPVPGKNSRRSAYGVIPLRSSGGRGIPPPNCVLRRHRISAIGDVLLLPPALPAENELRASLLSSGGAYNTAASMRAAVSAAIRSSVSYGQTLLAVTSSPH